MTSGGWPSRSANCSIGSRPGDGGSNASSARLPPHHPRRRHLLGVADLGDRPGHLVLVAPRIQLDGVDRHALGSQRLHRFGDTGPDRPADFGAIPVGGAVVRPVRQVRGDRVGVARPARPLRLARRTPIAPAARPPSPPTKIPSVVEKPAGTSSRSPCQPQTSPPSTTPMTCSCGWSSGASNTCCCSTRASSSPSTGGECRFGRRVEVEVERRTGDHRQARTGCRRTRDSSGSPSTRTATWAPSRENQPVAMPVRSRVAVNRTRSTPLAPVRSSSTPSGSTASPRRTSGSMTRTSSSWQTATAIRAPESKSRPPINQPTLPPSVGGTGSRCPLPEQQVRSDDKQRRADLIRDGLSDLGQVGVWLILAEGAWSQA